MSQKPTSLDAVKIQARAVIPIVRALERELGKERALHRWSGDCRIACGMAGQGGKHAELPSEGQ